VSIVLEQRRVRTKELKRRCACCGLGRAGNTYEILPTGADTVCVECRRHQSRLFEVDTDGGVDADSGQRTLSPITTSEEKVSFA
jgi:hypothetical protein